MTAPVSIVIPIHNGAELLRGLFQSIRNQSVKPLEVIAVDNGSTDGAPEVAAEAGARVITMGKNAGFAAAVNRGIQAARGEGIALVNSDVELDARWLETLWRRAGDGGFATGKILQARTPQLLDGAYDLISRSGCAWRAGAGRPASVLCKIVQIRFCPGTAAVYHTSVFQKIGLFDQSFDSYLEDVDFGLRCAAAGIAGWYEPEAVCRHYGSATFGRWSPRVVRLIARNQIFLIARHYPRQLIRRWFWPIVLGQLLWGCLAVRHGCGLAYLSGKLEGLRRFGTLRGTGTAELEPVILASEREIWQLQSAEGFDAYWRVYFGLGGRGWKSLPSS